MVKMQVIYETWNPNKNNVAFVAIQIRTEQPYVWATYSRNETLPKRAYGIIVLPVQEARNIFDFKEGKLADLAAGNKD